MKKTMIALGLVAVLLLGVSYSFARGPGFGPGKGPGACRGFWQDSSLTAEQKTKLQELRRNFVEETAKLRGTMVTKRLELQSLWTDAKADSKAIQEKEKEVSDLRNQMHDKAVQLRLEARNVLTPEQIAKFGPHCGMGRGFGRGRI